MTKTEQAAIASVIKRLQEQNLGCSHSVSHENAVAALNNQGIEAASRLYLDTWIIPALELLLPGAGRNPDLALKLAQR